MIGIAGGSSSGKTTVTERLVSMTGADHLSLIELDSYYLDLGDTPIEERRAVNYDHPDAFDWALLNDHLLKIFVDTAADIRLIRRLRRDVAERGRTPEFVIDQYLETVRPATNGSSSRASVTPT
jgi:uridine kinase